jgi:hypothetical protein
MLGAVIAFGIAIACVSAIREVAAAEAAVITAPGTAPVTLPQPLINRPQPVLSEPDTQLNDREQLRRYFLQDARSAEKMSARHDPASVAVAGAT